MGLMKKIENLYFLILSFCFHEATLEAYLDHSRCASDMVDSALKNMGLVLFKHDYKKIIQVILAGLSEN